MTTPNKKTLALPLAIAVGLVGCFAGCGTTPRTSVQPQYAATTAVTVKNSKFKYYKIRGKTVAALRAEMARLGPNGGFARAERRDAWLAWWLSWQWWGTCPNSRFGVTVTSTYTLPNWLAKRSAPAALRKKWQRFMKRLRLHQNGHREIAIRAGTEIFQMLNSLPSQPCDTLRSRAGAMFKRILKKYHKIEQDYDVRTDHGKTQGARLK